MRQDVRHAKPAADFDQLTSRDDDLAAVRQRRQHQQRRGGVIVGDERGLGAGQLAQQPLGVRVPMAALAGLEVVFEIRIAGGDFGRARNRFGSERRPAEVRVHDHSGRVDDRTKRRGEAGVEPSRASAARATPSRPPQTRERSPPARFSVARNSSAACRAARVTLSWPCNATRRRQRRPRNERVDRWNEAETTSHGCGTGAVRIPSALR